MGFRHNPASWPARAMRVLVGHGARAGSLLQFFDIARTSIQGRRFMSMTKATTEAAPALRAAEPKAEPALKLNFLSHGTLESRDLEATRKFYEEFLGLEVHRTSPISLMARLGGQHVYAVVQSKNPGPMSLLNHNGLDVETKSEVDECYRIACEQAEKWGLHKISKPIAQHGTYSFYFWDMDDNCWEILTNPRGGYTWIFEKGDLEGKGHMDKSFHRPGMDR
jgi:catechol 2,3-dioxygenase-like lactoylglutathione lyase family enzyme